MAYIGISLIVASVVLFCLRPRAWLPSFLATLSQRRIDPPAPRPPIRQAESDDDDKSNTHDSARTDAEEKSVASVPQPPPPLMIHEPQVQIQLTHSDSDSDSDAAQRQLDEDVFRTERAQAAQIEQSKADDHADRDLRLDISDDKDNEDEEVEEEEQTTPKAIPSTRDDPVPVLILPDTSIPADFDDDTAIQQPPPPSFTMNPPPIFHIEPPAARLDFAHQEKVDDVPQPIPAPPPQLNLVEPEQTPSISPVAVPTPQFNFVAPEETSPLPPARAAPAPPPQLNINPAPPPSNSASDLMPPPPRPKPRASGIPVPTALTPTKRISSLNGGRRPPSPDSRIPSPTSNRTPSPTTSPTPSPITNRIPNLTSRIPSLTGTGTAPGRTASPTPNRVLPVPNRRAPGAASSSSSGLMPPPTATSIPKKPSRQVSLSPGHSPLDWARLAQQPTSDLRNLPSDTPYLRVTPSMLKVQNGRKGRDAWTAYGGRVYNVSPYIPFHPGGAGELLRGAGKDGTRLFAEVHPWVNYETMLQSCLIGLLVDEGEVSNQMEEMD